MEHNIETTIDYYDSAWSQEQIKTLENGEIIIPAGFHWGLFEKGIKTWREASFNMNNYIGNHLKLNHDDEKEILDAGCGMGVVSLYLANIFPNVSFTGLTLAPKELALARELSKRLKLNNVKFFKKNYLDTEFSDNYFDGIFALESLSYANYKKLFIDEMYRILKPGGKLIIIDGFRKDMSPKSVIYKLYMHHFKKNRGGADIIIKEKFLRQLKSKGFHITFYRDLSMNIFKNFYLLLINNSSKILKSSVTKNNNKINVRDKKHRNKFPLIFFDCIFGLLKVCSYEIIVAEKS